ncbi:HpcH/HpaI aldolase/citrate lyase family protein [Amnibacterium kyonggiense]|uniref:Citrate lyase subunit beta/citryl-CoA lyase n=1 Tax=Amnibacterium kyonggiense TaxID=595671 RepID=A0A4R7FLH9_9MICO|nr:aldolase/citrate lyase family protein [Amnibacterium kyonggiense]TDS77229.1 citrate lyase subunit beta/citryl-CoA lyase [Amnibacterium kyonggiense]
MTPLLTGLYVPGDRPDRFAKAFASGADLVVLDLEDAVAPDRKAAARETVVAALAEPHPGVVVQVRIDGPDDLHALAAVSTPFEVRVPKASAARLDAVAAALPGVPLTALLEDAAGVLDARSIAAQAAVTRVGLGEADLRSAVGSGAPVIEFARVGLVYAAAAAGLPAPMLSAWTRLDDEAGLEADTRAGAALGFVGRMAVHPRQLAVVERAFAPAQEAVALAHAVLAATAEGGVARLPDGRMVDPAMRREAERVVELDARTSAPRPPG